MNPRVLSVEYQGDHKFLLNFSNNEKRVFDLTPYLKYPVYEELRNESFCKRVRAFKGTIQWDNDIDFDPDRLYLESTEVL
ncbi:MAG TPA: DUF2442 domain-containing protein [Chitinophagaceae bacterium]|nr:DUF2442 domain-containing protein [Chitinophagaceae bacterium]